MAVLTVLVAFVTMLVARLLWILPLFRTQPGAARKSSANIVVVLGSGGHTAEMLRLIEPLDFDKYTRRVYVVSSGDTLSEGKAQEFESWKKAGNMKVCNSLQADLSRLILYTFRERDEWDSLGLAHLSQRYNVCWVVCMLSYDRRFLTRYSILFKSNGRSSATVLGHVFSSV
jgi:hypothetical protein